MNVAELVIVGKIINLIGPEQAKEGDIFNIKVATDFTAGSQIYWQHWGTGLTDGDLLSSHSGIGVANAEGSFEIPISINNDNLSEGFESIRLDFFEGASPDWTKALEIPINIKPRDPMGDCYEIPILDISKRKTGSILWKGTWKLREDLTRDNDNLQPPPENLLIPAPPIDSAYEFSINGNRVFVLAVDLHGESPVYQSRTLIDQKWNIVSDTNNNGHLDPEDPLVGSYDNGRDGLFPRSFKQGTIAIDSNANVSGFTDRNALLGTETIDEIYNIIKKYQNTSIALPDLKSVVTEQTTALPKQSSTPVVTTTPQSKPVVPAKAVPASVPAKGVAKSSPTSSSSDKAKAATADQQNKILTQVCQSTSDPDVLTGKTSVVDTFVFSAVPNFNDNADHVINFSLKDKDQIKINANSHGVSSKPTFKIAANTKDLNKLLSTSVNFIYCKSDGGFYFNQDASLPGYGAGGLFLVLENRPVLTASSVQFV